LRSEIHVGGRGEDCNVGAAKGLYMADRGVMYPHQDQILCMNLMTGLRCHCRLSPWTPMLYGGEQVFGESE